MAPSNNAPSSSKIAAKPVQSKNQRMPSSTKKVSKRKAKGVSRKGGDSCPIFLQKTYLMVDTCNPEIASWSEDKETSFVVKNPERFASEIIPQYFKHSNFASFVRQLNFYGFRKIKSDPIKLVDEAQQKESKYWYFKHDLFVKGRRDLLNEIRKANQVPVQDQEDVSSLKTEVSSLKQKIAKMNTGIEKLSSLVEKMEIDKHVKTPEPEQPQLFQVDEIASDLLDFSNVTDLDLLIEDGATSCSNAETDECHDVLKPLPSFTQYGQDKHSSLIASSPTEMELEDSLLFHDLENDVVALSTPSEFSEKPSPSINNETSDKRNQEPGSDFRQPLYDCLAVLPRKVQEQIVNGLAETVANPDFFNDQINMISSLAKMLTEVVSKENDANEKEKTSSADPLTTSIIPPDEEQDQNSDLTLKLVSTVMAAFITQQKAAITCRDHPSNANHTSLPIQV